ncbi:MAG: hypothetical protein WCF84_03375 [Anaerolineae bacterium]
MSTRLTLFLFSLLAVLALGLAACTPAPTPMPTPDAKATETQIASNIYATQTASVPTATNTPTSTSTPTATLTPTVTNTPTVTSTPTPTAAPRVAVTIPANAEVVITSTLVSGWTQYQVQSAGFAIALPPGWQRIDLSAQSLDVALGGISLPNTNIQAMLSNQNLRKLFASGVRFYALDTSPTSLSTLPPTSANVLKLNVGSFSLDTVVQLTLTQLKSMADPSVPLTHRSVTLANIQAERLEYASKVTMFNGETQLVHVIQYVMMDGPNEYVVTLGGDSAYTKNAGPLWTQIGETFSLLK